MDKILILKIIYWMKNEKEYYGNLMHVNSMVEIKQVKVLNHSESEEHAVDAISKQILKEINEKPISLIGEATMISNWPENWNNQGLCQRIFVKVKVSDNPETFNYEPRFSCAWRENFKGTSCNEWSKGFYGGTWYPWPRNPSDHIIWGVEGIWDDGVKGTGKCACLDTKTEGAFWSGGGIHPHHSEEEVFTFGFIILVLIALSWTLLLYLYHKYKALQAFPESVTAIIFGTIVGLFIKYYYQSNYLMKILSFEPHTFFLFLLPPIMYEAGFSLKANIFFRSFLTISAYAILATALATLIFSIIFYFMSSLTASPFFFIDSFQFGWLISAIDPVATISIFKSLRVSEKKLYMIVFGESAINDAVSIALARSAENVAFMIENHEAEYVAATTGAIAHFMMYFFGSMIVGAICGVIVSYIFLQKLIFMWFLG